SPRPGATALTHLAPASLDPRHLTARCFARRLLLGALGRACNRPRQPRACAMGGTRRVEPARLVDAITRALPGAGPVEIRETHMSLVFLTATEVFKLKKPIRLPHLDFSTAERRRHFCEEEYRLNQRLAPETYLGVVPLCRAADGGVVLGGLGAPLDWLVH